MQLNADYSKRAVQLDRENEWVASPLPGVERRMIERNGEEVARATSIVRYAPESRFSPHVHRGGEEFLVLEGTFSDEMGDFPKGTYVRNPVGSRHEPSSAQGCTILVKLWQMPREDQAYVRLDFERVDGWEALAEGAERLALHETAHESVAILKLAQGALLPEQSYPGGAEFFVLDGDFSDGSDSFETWDWLRLPPGSKASLTSRSGARLYVKTGHLADPPPLPGST